MRRGLVLKILLALASVMLGVGILVVVGEIALRHRERTRETPPGTLPLLYYRHARFGHALVRNADYFGWVHIDSLGFRGRGTRVAKTPGVVRIVAMGASTTFDPFVRSDDATWPARTKYWIDTLAPDIEVEVINAGVPGYGIADDFLRMQTDIARLQPDVVIQLHGHNDLFRTLRLAAFPPTYSDRPDEIATRSGMVRWLETHSLLYVKVLARMRAVAWRSAKPSAGRAVDWRRSIDEGARRFARELDAFTATAQMLGARVVLTEIVHVSGTRHVEVDSVLARNWRHTVPIAPVDTVLHAYARFNDVVRKVSADRGALLIPATTWGLVGAQYYTDDDPIHFNDAGADLMGRRMAEALLASGVLPRPARGTATR
jgi:lysophospholipase L1-like esterase